MPDQNQRPQHPGSGAAAPKASIGPPKGPPPRSGRQSGPAPPPPKGPPPKGAGYTSGRSVSGQPNSARMSSKLAVLKQAGRLQQKRQVAPGPPKPTNARQTGQSTYGLSLEKATEILRRDESRQSLAPPGAPRNSHQTEQTTDQRPALIRPDGNTSVINRVQKNFPSRPAPRSSRSITSETEKAPTIRTTALQKQEDDEDECDSVTSEPPVITEEAPATKTEMVLELPKEAAFTETYISKGIFEIELVATKNVTRFKEMKQIKEQIANIPESEKEEATSTRMDRLKDFRNLTVKLWIEPTDPDTKPTDEGVINLAHVGRSGELSGPERHRVRIELKDFADSVKKMGPLMLRYQFLEGDRAAIGSGAIDIRAALKAIRNPAKLCLPIVHDYTRQSPLLTDSGDATGGLFYGTIRFLPAQMGILVVTCLEGINLPNKETMGSQDPYVRLTFGKQIKRSNTVNNGGSNPIFDRDELELKIDENNWTKDVQVNLWDDDVGRDDHIGQATFSGLAFMQSLKEQVVVFDLRQKGGASAGQVRLQLQYFPAGTLRVTCVSGRNLTNVESVGYQDPYTTISIQQQFKSYSVSTEVDWSGGSNPQWNQTFSFQIVDAINMKLEVYDSERIGPDKIVGSVSLPLLPVFKKGVKDGWIPIKTRTSWGKLEDRGEIYIEVDFIGPAGVFFPQRRLDDTTYDDSQRMYRGGKKPHLLPLDVEGPKGAQGPTYDMTFTDKEIEDAFNFIDLDHNLRVGPAEVRHILTCMGQLITEQEVDMMIDMVDADGDGSISFKEFYSIIRHPEPAHANFKKSENLIDPYESKKPPTVALGKPQKRKAAPAGLVQKQREEKERRKIEKLKTLRGFLAQHNFVGVTIREAYEKFILSLTVGTKIDIDTFLSMFGLDGNVRDKEVFKSFQSFSSDQKVDSRELCLCLSVLCEKEKNRVIDFFADMYDPNNKKELSVEQIEQLMKATHFAESVKEVRRKAATVMRSAGGSCDRESLKYVTFKFPELIFPSLPA